MAAGKRAAAAKKTPPNSKPSVPAVSGAPTKKLPAPIDDLADESEAVPFELEVEDEDEVEDEEEELEVPEDLETLELEAEVGLAAEVVGAEGVEVAIEGEADEEAEGEEAEEETEEALGELEAEELALSEDEVAEALLVDERAEIRSLRREELALDVEAELARPGEFVCTSCFLVKRLSQLADTHKRICRDCAV